MFVLPCPGTRPGYKITANFSSILSSSTAVHHVMENTSFNKVNLSETTKPSTTELDHSSRHAKSWNYELFLNSESIFRYRFGCLRSHISRSDGFRFGRASILLRTRMVCYATVEASWRKLGISESERWKNRHPPKKSQCHEIASHNLQWNPFDAKLGWIKAIHAGISLKCFTCQSFYFHFCGYSLTIASISTAKLGFGIFSILEMLSRALKVLFYHRLQAFEQNLTTLALGNHPKFHISVFRASKGPNQPGNLA